MTKNKNIAIMMAFASVLTISPIHDANAAWGKGSSSVRSSMSYSRSYSPTKSYNTFSKSTTTQTKVTGYGGSAPPSLSTRTNPVQNPYTRTTMGQQSKTISQDYSRKNSPISSPPPRQTTVQNRSVVKNYKVVNVTKVYHTHPYAYHGHYYSVPMYYHPYHDTYGTLNAFFLGAMLSHAMQPNYYNWAYAHYNDPNYLAWHADMVNQSQQNADLAAQLSVLDAKVDQLRAQNAPVQQNTIPTQDTEVNPTSNQSPGDEDVSESVPQQVPEQPSPTTNTRTVVIEKDKGSSGIMTGILIGLIPVLGIVIFIALKIL